MPRPAAGLRGAFLRLPSPEPEDLALVEVPAPAPGPDEVLIEVHACGVNFPDLLLIAGLYDVYGVKEGVTFVPRFDRKLLGRKISREDG